jgi:stage II sporulation protein M
LIIKAITLSFFIFLAITIIFTVIAFNFCPDLSENLNSFAQTLFNFENIPSPYTAEFLSFIFLNNCGHFWNPIRMIVWIPVIGPILLAFEIILNSGVIGVISVIIGINNGISYPLIGLIPHGIIEIPGFLLQLSSIILWQVTISELVIDKLKGKSSQKQKIRQRLIDTLILALTSICLLFIAAVIETYVTPYLLNI